jgi:acetyl-CoA acetyltransferase
MSLKERGAITGIGETAYSRNSGKSVVALQMEASLAALADAGLAPTDIDGIIAYAPSGVVAEDFVTNFGIPDLRFSATTPMGGASAVAAVQCALAVVATGVCRHVLIPLGRNGAESGPQTALKCGTNAFCGWSTGLVKFNVQSRPIAGHNLSCEY